MMFRAGRGETVATGWDVDATGEDVKWVECLISGRDTEEVKRQRWPRMVLKGADPG